MKKVLLATTALALTTGVASAEITFSGKGEAGFYRTGKAAENKGTLKSTSKDVTFTSDIAVIDYDNINGKQRQNGLSIVTSTAGSLDATEHAAAVTAYRNAVKALATAQAGGNRAAIAQAAFDLEVATLDLDGSTAGSAAVKTSDMMAYSGYDLNVAASGASDNGMTFAMAFDMGAGSIADQDDDRALDAQAAAVDTSALTIGYAGYTLAIGDEKVDDQYDADGWNADVSLSGSLGDLTFTIATDLDDDVAAVAAVANKYDVDYTSQVLTADVAAKAALTKAAIVDYTAGSAKVAAVYNPTSYSIGYKMGDVAFSMAGTEHDAYGNAAAKMSLTYTVSDALSATVSSDNVGSYKDIGKLSATYKLSDMLTLTASVKDDKDHALNTNTAGRQSSDVTVAYSAGAMAASFNTDESSNWWVNAQYDLGGGAQAFTTFDHTEFLVAGVNFAF